MIERTLGHVRRPEFWVVIPARMGASRLPGKPLLELGGLPLVEHVRRRAHGARAVSRVLVATDDAEIAEVIRGYGGEVVMTGAAASGTHRAALAVRDPAIAVVNVQGDMPMLDPVHVDRVVELVAAGAMIATLSATWPLGADPGDPALVKVGAGPEFTRRPIAGARLHLGIYGFAPGVLALAAGAPPSARSRDEDLEQLAWIDAGLTVAVGQVDHAHPGVDTPAQLDAVRSLLGARDLLRS